MIVHRSPLPDVALPTTAITEHLLRPTATRPAELEALLVTHPAVADVAVVGIDDVEAGELPKAFVVRKPGAEVSAADLQDFVARQVAHYKQIRIVEFTDEIPKSPSGKILRSVLRSRG